MLSRLLNKLIFSHQLHKPVYTSTGSYVELFHRSNFTIDCGSSATTSHSLSLTSRAAGTQTTRNLCHMARMRSRQLSNVHLSPYLNCCNLFLANISRDKNTRGCTVWQNTFTFLTTATTVSLQQSDQTKPQHPKRDQSQQDGRITIQILN